MIPRFIQKNIKKDLFKGKVIVIYGARQVGKTTLVKKLCQQVNIKSKYFNCDEPDIRAKLINKTSTELKQLIGGAKLVIFDEAQRVKNIGLVLKLLVDTFSNLQIIATGSSSFNLSNRLAEPLTGRSYEYTLFPISELEIAKDIGRLETQRTLEMRLRYGNYPEIVETQDEEEKKRLLIELKNNYLFKDILSFEKIKGTDILYSLLQALALQIGQEISLNELASLIGIDKKTVQRYLQIFEKAFITFRLRAFSRNIRKEIGKRHKIYFYDLGLRNSLINNFNPPFLRRDIGSLWENYIIAERIKKNSYQRNYANIYFWRTYDQQEIDLIEEKEGKIAAYEIKWRKKKVKVPVSFLKTYKNSQFSVINKNNYLNFII